jgi:uncharacterized protein (TIGR02145 family)
LQGTGEAGGKMKETGTNHWNSPNTGATNLSGFTARPGGIIDHSKRFQHLGEWGFWWSATEDENNTNNAYYLTIGNIQKNAFFVNYYKHSGVSVRCVKD